MQNPIEKGRLEGIIIRPIEQKDNETLARVIRTTLEEFGANQPGTVYYDASTDALYELFRSAPGSRYYVALRNDQVVGGGGIYPTEGLPAGTVELVKMYLHHSVRGLGLGRALIQQCLNFAKDSGYQQVYLETMPELQQAMKTYEKFGFRYLDKAMGNTGHFGCALWMLKELQ